MCLLSLFYDRYLLQGIRSHWYQTFDCLSVFCSLEEKKEVNKLIFLQCSMNCLIIQFPWLAAAKGYKNNTNWNYSCFISPSELQSPIFFLLINCCTSSLGHKWTAKNSVSRPRFLVRLNKYQCYIARNFSQQRMLSLVISRSHDI